jgi:hypothetical protein
VNQRLSMEEIDLEALSTEQARQHSISMETTPQRNSISSTPQRAAPSMAKLRGMLAIFIFSINIGSAVAYLMFDQAPIPTPGYDDSSGPGRPQPQAPSPSQLPEYLRTSVLGAWCVSMLILLIHGAFFSERPGRTPKSYAIGILTLSATLCVTITFALRSLSANPLSGILLGVSLSVLFIQTWDAPAVP